MWGRAEMGQHVWIDASEDVPQGMLGNAIDPSFAHATTTSSSDVDFGSYIPDVGRPTGLEVGVSWFKLLFASAFIPICMAVVIRIYRCRNVFEIRARSAYLVMLIGVCVLTSMGLSITVDTHVLFETIPRPVPIIMAYFFVETCITSCYICRVIRLAVLFNTRARRLAPWLIAERHHVAVCLIVPTAILAIPVHDFLSINETGHVRLLTFVEISSERLWTVQVAFEAIAVALYPFARAVDDIFAISPELRVLIIWLLASTVGGRLGEAYGNQACQRWLNVSNMGFASTTLCFVLTLLIPLKRLLSDPDKASDRVSAALARRRRKLAVSGPIVPRSGSMSSPTTSSPPEIDFFGAKEQTKKGTASEASTAPRSKEKSQERAEEGRAHVGSDTGDAAWTYEKLGVVPELATAFEEFARKALCQESMLFLQEVSRYQTRPHDQPSEQTGFARDFRCFEEITQKFIFDGAPDEVNISAQDRKSIMDLYNKGRPAFEALPWQRRRLIFADAYVDIRYMLEANLLHRFVKTEDFRAAQLQAARSW